MAADLSKVYLNFLQRAKKEYQKEVKQQKKTQMRLFCCFLFVSG